MLPVSPILQPRTPTGATPKTPTELLPRTPQDVCDLLPPPLTPLHCNTTAASPQTPPKCTLPQIPDVVAQLSGSPPDCKRLKRSICDQQFELSKCGGGLQCDDGSHILSEDEQQAFLAALCKSIAVLENRFGGSYNDDDP
jgi:hypothetical protein